MSGSDDKRSLSNNLTEGAGAPEGEEDFAAMLADAERSDPRLQRRTRAQPGDRVKGKIVSIGGEVIILELEGGLGEGMLDAVELRDARGHMAVAVGDTVDAVVVEPAQQGRALVLRRTALGRSGRGSSGATGGAGELLAELANARDHGLAVEGVVTASNKGGLEVTVSGLRAFCPLSQIDLRPVADPAALIGQRLSFRVLRIEGGGEDTDEAGRRGPNVVLSRRALLEDEARARAAVTRTKLAVGAVLPGVVTGLRDFGAFVDLGGIEGLLHVSELGFGRVGRPSDVLTVGQPVVVQVIRIEKRPPPKNPTAKTDPNRTEQVALSLKSLTADPWDEVASRFPEGTRARGTVTRVEAFGAFVELAPGIEGLVHVSALAGGRALRHAREVVKPGQSLDVTVTTLDRERRRLSLVLVAPGDDPLDDADPTATAAVRTAAAGPAKFGTLGDLLKQASSQDRGGARGKDPSSDRAGAGRRRTR